MWSQSRVRKLAACLAVIALPIFARAEYRLGVNLGYGGTGIQTVDTISGQKVSVSRGDTPGVVGLNYEFLTSDRHSIAFDHTRGFALSPFSSGVGFTGATWRWFYRANAPDVHKSDDKSTLILSRRVPFFGLSTGLAAGTITRGNDLVHSVSASGVYWGMRGGYDLQTDPGKFFRFEVFYATTPGSSGLVQSTLSAFALQGGWYFLF